MDDWVKKRSTAWRLSLTDRYWNILIINLYYSNTCTMTLEHATVPHRHFLRASARISIRFSKRIRCTRHIHTIPNDRLPTSITLQKDIVCHCTDRNIDDEKEKNHRQNFLIKATHSQFHMYTILHTWSHLEMDGQCDALAHNISKGI